MQRFQDLWNAGLDREYTESEMKFLRIKIKLKGVIIKYGFYRKKSASGKQIAVIFDFAPQTARKSGAANNWDVLCEREITSEELDEFIVHYFPAQDRRFLVFYYRDIEHLLSDDQKLDAVTPPNFIDECRRRGYTINHYEMQN